MNQTKIGQRKYSERLRENVEKENEKKVVLVAKLLLRTSLKLKWNIRQVLILEIFF